MSICMFMPIVSVSVCDDVDVNATWIILSWIYSFQEETGLIKAEELFYARFYQELTDEEQPGANVDSLPAKVPLGPAHPAERVIS